MHNNAENLRWATPTENESDKRQHGTHLKGEMVANAVAVGYLIESYFDRFLAGESTREIGASEGMTAANVRRILRRESWLHVQIPDHKVIAAKVLASANVGRYVRGAANV